MKEKYAICDDCKEPITDIFGIYDYAGMDLKEHTVCRKCIQRWIDSVGNKKAKKLVVEKRRKELKK